MPTLSPKRLAANRRNALKSTGPRTELGKASSAANALKTGINAERLLLPTESPEKLERISAAWRNNYPDPTPHESGLVDILIRSCWLLHRLARIDAELTEQEQEQAAALSSLAIGRTRRTRELRAAALRNEQFRRIARRRETLSKDFLSAENELDNLRASRALQPAAPSQPEQNTTPDPAMALFFRITPFAQTVEPVAQP